MMILYCVFVYNLIIDYIVSLTITLIKDNSSALAYVLTQVYSVFNNLDLDTVNQPLP